MNTRTMRKFDHFFGLPLCWIASFLTMMFRVIAKPRKREVTGKGKIVVFKFFVVLLAFMRFWEEAFKEIASQEQEGRFQRTA